MNDRTIDEGVRIGHVHLKVADLERALGFYCGVLGFELMQRFGDSAAFISAGGYHHHIGLNTWQSKGGTAPPAGSTGLYHVAIVYPTRMALGDALRRLRDAGVALDGAADHGVSEALYLRDPDGNGVELYWDRPRTEWPTDAQWRACDVHPLPGSARAAGCCERKSLRRYGRSGRSSTELEQHPSDCCGRWLRRR